jgi:quercetin dioxygenase-like cupin family protein
MSIERAHEHPTFEAGGNTVTSLAAPSRGATEAALFRTEVPPGGGIPRHHHDHLDVFTLERGSCTFFVGDEVVEVGPGDSMVIPIGVWHHLEAGPDGATITVAMLGGTLFIREDGSGSVPPWLS